MTLLKRYGLTIRSLLGEEGETVFSLNGQLSTPVDLTL